MIWIFVGGGIGALSRIMLSQMLNHSFFPYGTWLANIIGSCLLGIVVKIGVNDTVFLLLGIGFCGAFTTFSTFSLETIKLLEEKKWLKAGIYVSSSIVVSLVIVLVIFLM
ncbi:CrcB protein [Salirhabdus euzebyi]|uniref:Fluoride-specific ion channel FluC n=1 Tax=Salirhabdus euzebyi TaxID=394506 RepID=A0A841Q504_9BACI|nr:fluoride efflux transporter CrcB [Salirhabdus euzebyi]MBB6453491.1 CrcB protein [Salirhabdus euzebyi]